MTSLPTDVDWRTRAKDLAEQLQRAGAIRDPAWHEVFARVPRHMFVPRWWTLDEYNQIDRPLAADYPDHAREWLDGIYSDQALVTQWADSEYDGQPVRVATSSASQPSVVATMLDRLDLADGHRVLEIGTGTGYHAALLSARLGAHLVSSVDIDPDLVTTASDKLATCGYHPRVLAVDGAAPPIVEDGYDRIIATCAVDRIPAAWLDRLAPGGRIIAPLTVAGGLAVLDHDDHGDRGGDDGSADGDVGLVSGHLDKYRVHFMPMRPSAAEAMTPTTAPTRPRPDPAAAHHGVTPLDPAHLDDPDFTFWVALHAPDLIVTATPPGSGDVAKIVYTGSVCASVTPAGDGEWSVRQQGGRPWDTVEAAWRSFTEAGKPERTRIVVTVHADGTQYFTLPDDQRYRWPLAGT